MGWVKLATPKCTGYTRLTVEIVYDDDRNQSGQRKATTFDKNEPTFSHNDLLQIEFTPKR